MVCVGIIGDMVTVKVMKMAHLFLERVCDVKVYIVNVAHLYQLSDV